MPTIFIKGKYRFYFFSREEERRHVHVSTTEGDAKIWIEPKISLAKSVNLKEHELFEIYRITKENLEEINEFWNNHFRKR